MKGSAINIDGVSKSLRSFRLDSINLQVNTGSVAAVLGNNGAGKSILFKLIMNLLQTEQGTIQLMGQTYKENEIQIKQKTGYIGGQFQVLSHLSIRQLASFICRWYPTWNQAKYQKLLKRYQIDEDVRFAQCSTGVQKKVEFIFVMAYSPDLLILDEPTTGVDLFSQRKMTEDLLHFMEDDGKCILIASHNFDEINRIADDIYVLDNGQITHSFNKDEIGEKWARIWINHELPEELFNHPHIIDLQQSPLQVVTNNLDAMENELKNHEILITHMQKLTLRDVIEYLTK